MPSSHAQFVSFFAVSMALFLLVRHDPYRKSSSSTHIPTSKWERLVLSAAISLGAAAVAVSRIYLNYHTQKQVAVGCVAGALCSVAWFILTVCLRRWGVLDSALNSSIARFCRIRDLVVNEDFVDAGWERWQKSLKQKRAEKDT